VGKSVVGLDIGASTVRAIQVSKDSKGAFQIEKMAQVSLPLGAVSGGSINDPNALVKALKTLWKEGKFSTRTVRMGVGSDAMNARVGEVDWAPDADLFRILPYTPLVTDILLMTGADKFYLDYHTLSEGTVRTVDPDDPDETIIERKKFILVAGGDREAIDAMVKAARSAGLKPISVDITGLALIRAFDHSLVEWAPECLDVSVDIGADTMTIVFHKAGQPLYMRTVREVNGNAITEHIAVALKTTPAKAELRKFEVLYSANETPSQSTPSTSIFSEVKDEVPNPEIDTEEDAKRRERNAKVRPIIAQDASAIIQVIRATLDHFLSGPAGQDLTRASGFMLSGGMSLTPGLAERIASEFHAPVIIASPLSSFSNPKRIAKFDEGLLATESSYIVAYGLAVGEGSSHA